MDQVISKHIEISPGVCGGRARIAGHRLRVQDIVVWHEVLGRSADEIIARYPQLTHADVYAALAYYFDNADEIRRQMNEDKAFAENLRTHVPSKLEQGMSGDPFSPG